MWLNQIRAELKLPVSNSMVWRALHRNGNVQGFTRRNLTTVWSKPVTISTDEQKFNLDEPDDMISHCKGSQKNPTTFSRRNIGGGSSMDWSNFSAGIRLEIVFVSGPMDSMKYQDTLHKQLLLFLRDIVDRSMPYRKLTPKCMPLRQPKAGF
ncbi:hypothetical protein ANCCAN_15282 [Ancylostoma caninum]|uniref:Transposable element Tc3 transposase-like DNA-binding HTH domain-containing protein n=1 Tax=Ancylostoma caninum TaxID=29170 RepID=A0A368G7X4_ANCCA|nr:hypothetical protein ANCCAN_15282 [Ancylostoma caninum]